MRIAICDDEKKFCIIIEQYIVEYCNEINLPIDLKIYDSAEKLLNDIEQGNVFDVIFLDIFMGEIDGIQAGKIIRNNLNSIHTEIVYITSSSDYYNDALDIRVFNYLQKPIENEKFEEMFSKLIKYLNSNPKLFTYSTNKIQHFIRISDIIYFEIVNRKVTIVTTDTKDTFYSSMKDVISDIDATNFIQPHRAYYVNFRYVVENRGIELLLANGDIIPVAPKKKKQMELEIMKADL